MRYRNPTDSPMLRESVLKIMCLNTLMNCLNFPARADLIRLAEVLAKKIGFNTPVYRGTPARKRRGRGGMMRRGWRVKDLKGVLVHNPRHASSTVVYR